MSLFFNKLCMALISLALGVGLFAWAGTAQAGDSHYYSGRTYGSYANGPLFYGDGYGNTYIFYRGRRFPTRVRGSNDFMYQRDNIYGIGASAAGRMGHITKNVPRPGYY